MNVWLVLEPRILRIIRAKGEAESNSLSKILSFQWKVEIMCSRWDPELWFVEDGANVLKMSEELFQVHRALSPLGITVS
jgi:hypothetical protein